MEKISIMITDDHVLIRKAWNALLANDARFEIVAESGTGEEAVQLAGKLKPDIVIMDINLPGINGIEATKQIGKCSPNSKVLAVSQHTHPAYAKKMLKEGARGYITKGSDPEEIYTAIPEMQKGNKYICREIKNILMEQQIFNSGKQRTGVNTLSKREKEVMGFVHKGSSMQVIADLLGISVRTVEGHRLNILKKLNLTSYVELNSFIENNLIVLENRA